jgi:NAD(P)-dependent dehydrogenase (short-subunit alcohol dehydrogenase family)
VTSTGSQLVLIIGPSPGGLGAETAISLAHGAPKAIILAGRSAEKCQPTVNAVKGVDSSINVKFVEIELASFRSVRKAARSILEDSSITTIDVIINNAGVMAITLTRNENDYEMHFAANHLGHFLLSNLLVPRLTKGTSRIINVSSSGNRYSGVNWSDVHCAYKRMGGYSQSKAAQILFLVALLKRGVRSYAVHPGSAQTNLGVHLDLETAEDVCRVMFNKTLAEAQADPISAKNKTTQQCAATQVVAALDPSLGEQEVMFLNDCQPSTDPLWVLAAALDEKDAERMWTLSEQLVGETFDL